MILRTYGCQTCGYIMEAELRADQWDVEPPECPHCQQMTHQEFSPPAIGGSLRARAEKIAEDIASRDYGVADMQRDRREGSRPQVRYKDQGTPAQASTWGANREILEGAIAMGRQNRLQYGSGLDILQRALKSGDQPDLIAASKRRSGRIW